MHPRIASPNVNFLPTTQVAVDPKPIVVNLDMSVLELLDILRRVTTNHYFWAGKFNSNSTHKLQKENEFEPSCLFDLDELQQAAIASFLVVVIENRNIVGVVTQQDLISCLEKNCTFNQITLLEVVKNTIAPFSNLQVKQLLKVFSLLQQYWVRCLPVVNSQGRVIGAVNCETMRLMIESYIRREYQIVTERQATDSDLDLPPKDREITLAPVDFHLPSIESTELHLKGKRFLNQLNDVRSLQEKLAQRTAEYQHINRQLQEQIDENFHLKKQLAAYQQIEQTTASIAQFMTSDPSLRALFERTITHVQGLFQCDRVCIYHYESNWNGLVIAEAVKSDFPSILNFLIRHDLVSSQQWIDKYQQGEVCSLEKIGPKETDSLGNELSEETITLMQFFQVESKLVVPIQVNDALWGLLVVHQCAEPRRWQPFEISLLQIIASSLQSAIGQSNLSETIQQLQEELNLQEKTHIHRLRQALDFEAMLNRVTDRVRDSLDEQQILQTAIQELVTVLGVRCCQVVLCSLPIQTVCELSQNYSTDPLISADEGSTITEFWELAQQAKWGQSCQFCLTDPLLNQGKNSILVCPIFDDQGYLGDLRLYARRSHIFNDEETGLVQQVASHCAIAIRQARLYQASQAQVQELEQLHQLKDDFLSTVSHELRTPLSSIKMVTNLLKMTLNQSYQIPEKTPSAALATKISHYLKVLEEECEREIGLVDDLLATQTLDVGSHPLALTTIELNNWVQPIVKSFQHRVHLQQQQFELLIADDLPVLVSDSFMLSRILVELLNNACKYTPAGEVISLELALHGSSFQISVKNSGVEISPDTLPRIFDPFYRIPKNDRWKTGGTGLGLSLIKRLVAYLGGKIWAASGANTVQFCVELPLTPPVA